MTMSFLLSVAAAFLQAVGYLIYIRMSLRHTVKPNGSTWLMFGYGVSLLTILEWDAGADPVLLLLPLVCAVLAVVTAYICWRRGTISWPKDWEDRAAFIADLVLTFLYVVTAYLASADTVTEVQKTTALNVFLIASNATAFTSFAPLVRGVWLEPSVEKPAPWTVWTFAYLLLGIATFIMNGWSNLLIYPVVNAFLHGMVAVLACRKRQ